MVTWPSKIESITINIVEKKLKDTQTNVCWKLNKQTGEANKTVLKMIKCIAFELM